MTPAEAKERMAHIAMTGDIENAHIDADNLLCDILKSLGYEDVVGIYFAMVRWYA